MVIAVALLLLLLILLMIVFGCKRPATKADDVVFEDECCSCGEGLPFFEHMEDFLSEDGRAFHTFLLLKDAWDTRSELPFLSPRTKHRLKTLVIKDRVRVKCMGRCFCMHIDFKNRGRMTLEDPDDGHTRFELIFPWTSPIDAAKKTVLLTLDDAVLERLLASKTVQLRDVVDGRRVDARLRFNMEDFSALKESLAALRDVLHRLLHEAQYQHKDGKTC